ncbi:substrate-binding domain-containing protein [Microvirga tunisiensis]|jgi:quinoprotein dehydrogenase-associated probable ABC transporter substrate-binding protein|uniref:Quinoprotein dehydrogenase-associated putative ABC transporter substrate-binding protein n=1 Tax=Microvirga tunisiensis TaxID=2108360 RepID=A0A5N7MZC0_9HYPH|nr:substrate-binding domain-containing protein [Microvirga tunisiensis]MPR11223.1 quinoprotein dehydrogenase-associated putative ABC transporter substrate-binding protein [Microvirga tunisiensis]MPR29296.1 quinoprotein dehydrogenase-associated putative ABC transporter substrate-binding protein [Microvirga tunisiensis]
MKIHVSDAAADLIAAAGISLAALLMTTGSATAQPADLVSRTALRVCADPANMPFSNEAGEGFENKIAELLAADLKLPLEYTWFPQVTGFVRNTLGAKRCDLVMGYVAAGEVIQNTNPYYRSAWVLVLPKDRGLDGIEALDDARLKGKRLGIVAGAPPATVMATNGLMAHAKPYALMVDRRYESPAEEMLRDIKAGEIEAGILWGPIAGYYVKKSGMPLAVVPLLHETKTVPMTYRITLGLRHGETEWKHRLNDFLDVYRVEIQSILLQYGVPLLDEQDNAITAP